MNRLNHFLFGSLLFLLPFSGFGQIKSFLEAYVPIIGIPVGEFRQTTKSAAWGLGANFLVQTFGTKSPLYIGPQFTWQEYGKRKFEQQYPLLGFSDKIKISNNIYNWNVVARIQKPLPKSLAFPYLEFVVGLKTIKNKVNIKSPWNSNSTVGYEGNTDVKYKDSALNFGVGTGLHHIVIEEFLTLSIGLQYQIGNKIRYVDENSIIYNPNPSTYKPEDYNFAVGKSKSNQLVLNLKFVMDTSEMSW